MSHRRPRPPPRPSQCGPADSPSPAKRDRSSRSGQRSSACAGAPGKRALANKLVIQGTALVIGRKNTLSRARESRFRDCFPFLFRRSPSIGWVASAVSSSSSSERQTCFISRVSRRLERVPRAPSAVSGPIRTIDCVLRSRVSHECVRPMIGSPRDVVSTTCKNQRNFQQTRSPRGACSRVPHLDTRVLRGRREQLAAAQAVSLQV